MTREKSLEALLLSLGATEREFEKQVLALKSEMKNAYASGNSAYGDTCDALLADARQRLADLRPKIVQIEAALYGLRRSKQKR